MRSILTSLLCVLCLTIAGCGGDSGSDSIVGTWAADNEAMKADVEKHLKPMIELGRQQLAEAKKQLDVMPEGEAKEQIKKMIAEGEARSKNANPLASVTVTMKSDGTYKADLGDMGSEEGTWKLDGETLTITATKSDGNNIPKPDARKGIYKNGQIRYRPDDEMPFDFVLKKQ